jgi:hypothetical protein
MENRVANLEYEIKSIKYELERLIKYNEKQEKAKWNRSLNIAKGFFILSAIFTYTSILYFIIKT